MSSEDTERASNSKDSPQTSERDASADGKSRNAPMEPERELLEERQLARSAGTISKPFMALAFGFVLALVGFWAAKSTHQLTVGVIVGGIGTVLILWAVYRWTRSV